MKVPTATRVGISRRHFLKTSTALGAFTILPSAVALGKESPNSKVRLAAIGVGNQGGRDIQTLFKSGHCDIVALCDIDLQGDHCQRSVDQFKDAKHFADFRKMFDEMADESDAVLALTGWDEVNILGCLVARAHGVATTVARFNRIEYVNLLSGVGIDAAVSSRLIAAGAILRFVRRGRIHSVVTFKDTDAEAIELEVDSASSVVGERLVDLGLPQGAVIGGILRNSTTLVPTGGTVLEAGDRIIFFTLPECIAAIEKLFGRE